MIPDCYQNVFAFRPNQGCGVSITPTSGLYIDDLEGLSLLTVGGTGKHTYKNQQDLLNAKTVFAIQKSEIWVQDAMTSRGFFMPQKQMVGRVCSYKSTAQSAATATWRGISLYRASAATFLANLYVESVNYKARTSGTAQLQIVDFDGNILYTSTMVVITADVVKVFPINQYYATNVRILIKTNTQPYDTSCDNCACLCSAARRGYPSQQMYFARGWDGAAESNSGYGVQVCAALRCNVQALMCYLMDILKMPLLYLTGAEIVKEWRQQNAPTAETIGYYAKDEQQRTIERWQKEAFALFQTQVDTVIAQLRELDAYCISCNTPQRIKINSLR